MRHSSFVFWQKFTYAYIYVIRPQVVKCLNISNCFQEDLITAVLNWGYSHPQGVREGTSWGANFSAKLLFSTKKQHIKWCKGCKNDFFFLTGCELLNELRTAALLC